MSRKGRTSACVLLFVLIGTACAGSADPSSWLEKRVCQFVFHGKTSHGERHHAPTFFPGDAMEAVRQLAFHADVPICTEELRPSGGEAIVPVEVNVKNASVGEILREVVAQDPRYAYRERLGVISFPGVQTTILRTASICLFPHSRSGATGIRLSSNSAARWTLLLMIREPSCLSPDAVAAIRVLVTRQPGSSRQTSRTAA